ncbi:hypothetical protein P3G55_23290 [Leptospira sp. 96542]|nr:hypothetical protein [Leptospira sp. 96542]
MNINDVLRYYVLWTDIESVFVKNREDLHFFRNYLNYMKVIRNFKSNSSKSILEKAANFNVQNSENLVQNFSNILNESGLLNNKINRALVASSKILWLFNQDIIIMDNFNILELKRLNYKITEGSYDDYCLAWNKEYEKCLPDIQNICSQLKNSPIESELFQKNWFQKRIFDMFLWNTHYQNNRINKNDD